MESLFYFYAAYALIRYILQNFDGNVLYPLVMSHTVKIPSAVTMFSLFTIGFLFGPVGLLRGGGSDYGVLFHICSPSLG